MVSLLTFRRGKPSKTAVAEIAFGQLFYETDNIFEALAGTLKTAKKYTIVHYEGDLLFQGANDATVIRLLRSEHEGKTSRLVYAS